MRVDQVPPEPHGVTVGEGPGSGRDSPGEVRGHPSAPWAALPSGFAVPGVATGSPRPPHIRWPRATDRARIRPMDPSPASAPFRRFLLEGALEPGPAPLDTPPTGTDLDATPPTLELVESDREHVLRVLRLGVGEQILGLDGRGGTWPLRIVDVRKRRLTLEPAGPPSFEPRPGDPGAPLPWIEVASALPRAGRAEGLLDRLTQIGVAAWTPLAFERSTPAARGAGPGRERRLLRAVGEACKQSRRSWIPQINGTVPMEEWLSAVEPARTAVLTPGSRTIPGEWLSNLGDGSFPRDRPLRLLVGPEGGLSASETALLEDRGLTPLGLGPHILRIETAAEAALAGLVQAWWARRGS